jgi:hypothetical protein
VDLGRIWSGFGEDWEWICIGLGVDWGGRLGVGW